LLTDDNQLTVQRLLITLCILAANGKLEEMETVRRLRCFACVNGYAAESAA
jgi:hypothetical protein